MMGFACPGTPTIGNATKVTATREINLKRPPLERMAREVIRPAINNFIEPT